MVLILFGADKLPSIARGLGKAMRQLRDATDEIKTEIQRGAEKAGVDTKIVEETQKEIEKMKKTIDNWQWTIDKTSIYEINCLNV